MKVLNTGQVLWKKIYSAPFSQFFTSATKLSDGTFAVTGSYFYSVYSCDKYTWVARIDQDGKMIWQKALGFLNTQSNGQSITNTFDGGFIVCGSVIDVNKTSTRIIKFNHDNKIEWERTFDIGIPLSITQTKDKGFAICGAHFIDNSLKSNIFVLRLNEYGNVLWQKIYEDFNIYVLLNGSIIENHINNLVIAAKNLIMEVDIVGNIIWSRVDNNLSLNSIIQKDYDNYGIAGDLLVNNYQHAFAATFNSNSQELTPLNTEILFPSSSQQIILVIPQAFAICGYIPYGNNSTQGFISIF
ncbi:MAG: hypothetical protein E7214_12575 [Clostridium sp.]|nr:hypothetical protein [Clostridium sp.]